MNINSSEFPKNEDLVKVSSMTLIVHFNTKACSSRHSWKYTRQKG